MIKGQTTFIFFVLRTSNIVWQSITGLYCTHFITAYTQLLNLRYLWVLKIIWVVSVTLQNRHRRMSGEVIASTICRYMENTETKVGFSYFHEFQLQCEVFLFNLLSLFPHELRCHSRPQWTITVSNCGPADEAAILQLQWRSQPHHTAIALFFKITKESTTQCHNNRNMATSSCIRPQ